MFGPNELCRRQFLDGTPVRLADGQFWLLADPPVEDVEPWSSEPFDPDRERYRGIIRSILDAEDEDDRRRAEFVLLINLLGRNYELSQADYRRLLGYPLSGGALKAIERIVHQIAMRHADWVREHEPEASEHDQEAA